MVDGGKWLLLATVVAIAADLLADVIDGHKTENSNSDKKLLGRGIVLSRHCQIGSACELLGLGL